MNWTLAQSAKPKKKMKLNDQSSYLETYFTGCISFFVAPSLYAISMSKLQNKNAVIDEN